MTTSRNGQTCFQHNMVQTNYLLGWPLTKINGLMLSSSVIPWVGFSQLILHWSSATALLALSTSMFPFWECIPESSRQVSEASSSRGQNLKMPQFQTPVLGLARHSAGWGLSLTRSHQIQTKIHPLPTMYSFLSGKDGRTLFTGSASTTRMG